MAQMHCPNCGAPIMDPNAHFCGNCGRALPAGMNPVSQMKPKENKASVEGKPDPEIKATPAPAPATPVKGSGRKAGSPGRERNAAGCADGTEEGQHVSGYCTGRDRVTGSSSGDEGAYRPAATAGNSLYTGI